MTETKLLEITEKLIKKLNSLIFEIDEVEKDMNQKVGNIEDDWNDKNFKAFKENMGAIGGNLKNPKEKIEQIKIQILKLEELIKKNV